MTINRFFSRRTAGLTLIALFAALPAGLNAQETSRGYIEQLRADLRSGKAGIYNEVMHLNEKESDLFWPIYQKYEDELFAWGDRRVEVIRQFAKAQRSGKMDDKEAKDIANKWFKLQQDRLDLWNKYYKRIANELSATRGAQFVQVEHQVSLVIDMDLASQSPLIGSAPMASSDKR
jgi:hypothetical protein